MAFQRRITTSHTRHWWPRRKHSNGVGDSAYVDEDGETEDFNNSALETQKPRNWRHQRRDVPRAIYILGTGSVGKLVAHSFAGIPNRPPVTLLLHLPTLVADWKEQGQSIKLETRGMVETRRGYEVELVRPSNLDDPDPPPNKAPIIIHNLIVSIKAPLTVSALLSVASRLTRDSTILFLRNVMGIIDEVNAKVFPDPETRPNYMVGVITHQVDALKSFSIVHTSMGTTALGLLPRQTAAQSTPGTSMSIPTWAPSSKYLLRTMTRTPVLVAVGFTPTELLQLQLEKLALYAVISPLTVMIDCTNGELLHNFAITRVVRLLLSEISFVIRSLPELQGVPNVKIRFSPGRLEKMFVDTVTNTANSISPMLQDVKASQETEIDYVNGYFVKRGEELTIKCVMNYMLLQLVKGKQQTITKRDDGLLPVEGIKAEETRVTPDVF